MVSTINSGVMLSTIGSIIVDPDHDVEMHGLGAMRGSSKGGTGEDGDSQVSHNIRHADQYSLELEMGFTAARPSLEAGPGTSGIRVDVEKTTSTW
jgi:hypothetical protein